MRETIRQIESNLEIMRGASALAQQRMWDLKQLHPERLSERQQEAIKGFIEDLTAFNRKLNSYILYVDSCGSGCPRSPLNNGGKAA